VLVVLRSQPWLSLERRARTLSGPYPDPGLARVPAARCPTCTQVPARAPESVRLAVSFGYSLRSLTGALLRRLGAAAKQENREGCGGRLAPAPEPVWLQSPDELA